MTDAERKALAEEVGFKCIGKELDDKVTLTEIVKSMPAEVSKPVGWGGTMHHLMHPVVCMWSALCGPIWPPSQLTHCAHRTQVFEIDNNRAWLTCATSVVAFSFSLWLISISPWYMLPFAWVFSGTALTGVSTTNSLTMCDGCQCRMQFSSCVALVYVQMLPQLTVSTQLIVMVSACIAAQWFVIGHECGHRSFHTDQLIEDIVGHIAFAPLLYPFECWRIMHNHHHAHTNK